MTERLSIKDFQKMKENGEKITMISSYTYPVSKIIDKVGIDSILVGDSLGMTIYGYDNTLNVNLEDSIRHTAAVVRSSNRALIIGDMPFLSYGVSIEQTISNAGRMIKDSGCQAIKLEGGRERGEEIHALMEIGIPVMGHIGLTPTYINRFGGFKVQGKTQEQAMRIIEEAKFLEAVGVFAIVLESIPWELGKKITEGLSIPTIGIGAGEYCDGQVLVIDDILGLTQISKPKFVKNYANIQKEIEEAVKLYKKEVKTGKFPDETHRYD